MLQSSKNILENKTSSNQIIKEALLSMEKYLDRNKTLSMALRELLSELDYNTDMYEARAEGKAENTRDLVLFNYKKGKSKEEIAEFLNIKVEEVNQILASNN